MAPKFQGPEPGTPEHQVQHIADEVRRLTAQGPGEQTPEVARFYWAAVALAADPDAATALMRAIPVPRNRLNPKALAALGEPAEGQPLALTDELALKLELHLPQVGQAKPEPGHTNGSAPEPEPEPEGEPQVFMDAYEFVRQQEEVPEPLWGTDRLGLMVAGGLIVFAGRPGTGKTTFVLDMACHLAAGLPYPPQDSANDRAPKPWPVPRPLRIALIENEGPREMFRDVLRAKLNVFGKDINEAGGYLGIQVWRWGAFSFADNDAFVRAEQELDALGIDLVIGDPLNMLGVRGVGSPEDTREFVQRLRMLGLGTHRAFLLIHHFRERVDKQEDELARISGAWGGHLDTLITLSNTSHAEQARLAWPKLRWAREVPPRPIVLGRVYNTRSFEALGEEDDAAMLEPLLAKALADLRANKGGYGSRGWVTSNRLAELVSRGRKPVRTCLEQAPHLFAVVTGEAARELGAKTKTTKLYGLTEWPEAPKGGQVAEPDTTPADDIPALPTGTDGDIPW